ncbi:phospholipase D-like domain-containing protein [Lysobacter changpingensis]|uniref:phospholipase D-like domain-containing protein n=1 Tax=Lysobacter changpingensis TaxID=2792784 RepID=UPI001A8D866E|nr:phospholipase D-like domain-containing protein [Lysobacter changpingensis]
MSLKDKRDANATMGWFVKTATFPPRQGIAVKPLINGQRTFAKIQETIAKAKHSVDIVSWGFDPSMRLVPPDGVRLGDLLTTKAREGVEVRVLIWELMYAGFVENNLPGNGINGMGGTVLGSGIGSTSAGGASRSKPDNGYGHGIGNSAAVARGDDDARSYNRNWFKRWSEYPMLEFHTRGYTGKEHLAIGLDAFSRNRSEHVARSAVLGATVTHHQKAILVDYQDPLLATGFVMGHNLMRNYWDTDQHTWADPRRNGFVGWQDISSQVWGPVLYDLHENFKRAWERSVLSRRPWGHARMARRSEDFRLPAQRQAGGSLAQICRTQVQEEDFSILSAYEKAIDNARNYLYFENQYFRYKPLATKLRDNRRKLKSDRWRGEFYVFVVTNLPEKDKAAATYDMLAEMGQGGRMPEYHKKANAKTRDEELRKSDLQGVKIHIATLLNSGMAYDGVPMVSGTASGGMSQVSLPVQKVIYEPIYVHSKLLLTDDTHFILGSANVNDRSMHGDSELCLSCPSPSLTRQWRLDLWKMHTLEPVGDNIKVEFERWKRIMEVNRERMRDNRPLVASMIDFQSNVEVGLALD